MTGRSKMNKRFHNMTQYGMLLDGSVSLKIQLIKDTTYNETGPTVIKFSSTSFLPALQNHPIRTLYLLDMTF
jgi:hypothetical protein